MMRIFVEDSFDAAHWLPNVPKQHKCYRQHGHTYRIRMEFAGELDAHLGWIIDYAEIKLSWDEIKIALDHQTLNEIPGLENPTAEHIALYIARGLSGLPGGALLRRIELRETERCGVIWEAE